MIGIIFMNATQLIEVRIAGHDIQIRDAQSKVFVPFNEKFMYLDYAGVCREFPDLKDNPQWKSEAIKRFKEKIRVLNTENKIAEYIISEFRSVGYIPKYKQLQGHRVEVIE